MTKTTDTRSEMVARTTAKAKGAWWAIITRHPKHLTGRWHHDGAVYETLDQAVDAAHELWDGTNVTWRLMTIPLADPDYSQEGGA